MSEMVEYHVLKTHSIAARYKKPSSGEWDRVVEIANFRGDPPVPVTAIREDCFSGSNVGLVTLPSSVSTVEARAFLNSKITSIVTRRTPGELHLKEIGNDAFRRSNLDGHLRLVCDETLNIGPDAFQGCTELEEIEIVGSGTVKIHPRAFMDCPKLRIFRCMEPKLASLPEQVFENCSELHTIAIPSLKRAGPRSCAGCISLYGFPAVLDSFYPDTFEGCNIKHPSIRKKKKCNDDTLRIPTAEEIEAMIPQAPDIGVDAAFQSFNKKYQNKEPIMHFRICSSGEKVDMMRPIIKGYFRKDLIDNGTFHFEVTVPVMEDRIHFTVECAKRYNPLLEYLGSSIVQVIGMQNGDQYNVFEIEPSGLSDSNTFSREFYNEIISRLTRSERTKFTIKTVDQARLFLKLMNADLPDQIVRAIQSELDAYQSNPADIQKHCLQALKVFCTLDFCPCTPVKIPPLDVIKKNFDNELGGMSRVKQAMLSVAARIRQTGKMPATRRGILLVGSPGTGKSHIIQTFCEQTGLDVIELDFSAMGDGSNLQGSGREFSNGTYSLVIRKTLQTEQRQMRAFVKVEELDKCPHLQNTLLNMLTGSFYDSYLETTFNTEQLFFLMTANSVSEISEPLLSRLKVIHLDSYSRDDKRKIMRKIIVPEANYNLKPGFQLQGAAEELILDIYEDYPGIREIKNAICGDLVDAYFLECERHPESHALRRVFSKSDVRRILGQSATYKSKTYDPNPGEVAFLYMNESGAPTRGVVQVSFTLSDTPGVEILGAHGMQHDYVRMAIAAIKTTTSFNLEQLFLTIAFPEPIQTKKNVLGLPVFLAIHSALREEPIAPGTLLVGAGIDLYANGILPKGPMTSLLKAALDLNATTVVAPGGFTDQSDSVDLERTPLIIESNTTGELVRFVLKT